MLKRSELIITREYWVARLHTDLWNIHGCIENDSDKWEQMAEKLVDESFMNTITELTPENK